MNEITDDTTDTADLRIANEAAEWLLRVNEDQSLKCRTEFAAWLRHSPRHMEEFLMLSATASAIRGIDAEHAIDVDALLGDPHRNVVLLQGAGKMARSTSSLKNKRFIAIAATAALAAVLLPLLYVSTSKDDYATALGEQRSFQMEDGSLLHLNTQSRVHVSYSEHARDISLLEGEALFVAAADLARPFRVIAGETVIQAIGTQFNVYRKGGETTVSVIEGRVKAGSAPILAAGEQLKLSDKGKVIERAETDVATAVAWRQLRLVFKAQRLDDIAAEFNRYNRTAIRVEGPAAERRLTGTFNANEPEGFLHFLQRDTSLNIQKTGDETVVRAR